MMGNKAKKMCDFISGLKSNENDIGAMFIYVDICMGV